MIILKWLLLILLFCLCLIKHSLRGVFFSQNTYNCWCVSSYSLKDMANLIRCSVTPSITALISLESFSKVQFLEISFIRERSNWFSMYFKMPSFNCCPFITVCCVALCGNHDADSSVLLSGEQIKKRFIHLKATFLVHFFLFLDKFLTESIFSLTRKFSWSHFPS